MPPTLSVSQSSVPQYAEQPECGSPPPPPPAPSTSAASTWEGQQCVDTGYAVNNPDAAPTAETGVTDQAKQAAVLGSLSAAAAASVAGAPMDGTAAKLLPMLDPTPPDVTKKSEFVDYTSTLKGVSPQAAYEYFKHHPADWFGASGITLHPPVSELHDGARVMLQEPGVTPPVWAPIEVHLDDAARTVSITTLDGHPLRGVNQFTFEENAQGDAVVHQSSVFQSSSVASEQGGHAMGALQRAGVPGFQDPIERQHAIWKAAHATIADQAVR